MANKAQYYEEQNIVVFPTSNSKDNGKLTLEENMRGIVTRITTRNYALTKSDFLLALVNGKVQIQTGIGNIQGYEIVTTTPLLLDDPIDGPGDYLIGFKLTKDSSDHLRGDVLDGNVTYYEGVWAGFFTLDSKNDKDVLFIGTVHWDGSKYTDLKRNPDLEHKIDASDIDVQVKGPKPPKQSMNLQEYIDKMPDWYVSKYGDFMVDTLEFVQNNGVTEGVEYPNTKSSGRITIGTSGDVGSEITTWTPNNHNIYSKLLSNKNGFTGLYLKNIANNDTYIGYPNGSNSTFYISSTTTGSGGGTGSLSFQDGRITVNSTDKGIYLSSPKSGSSDAITLQISNNVFKINTSASSTGHIFGYDATGVDPYYTLGKLQLKSTGNQTSINSTGNAYINITPNINTNILLANTSTKVGNNSSDYIETTPTSNKQYSGGSLINSIDSLGFSSSKGYGITSNMNNPYSTGTKYNRTTIDSVTGSINTVYVNPNGNSSISFSGAAGKSAKLEFDYTQSRLTLTGDYYVNGDIHATRVYNAVYNDYAELYRRASLSEDIEPGDVIEVDDNGNYTKSKNRCSNRVVGVCSDTYGHLLGGENELSIEENLKKYIPVGISGRVVVKVVGNINPGDLLISSDIPGVATKGNNPYPGTIIGKALGHNIGSRVLMQIMLG